MPGQRCAYCGHELEGSSGKCANCGATSQPAAEGGAPGASSLGGEPPPVGARVLGRWGDGLWYPGAVAAEKGPSRHVQFDDGDEAWLGASDLTVQDDPGDDGGGQLKEGARIQGQWADRNWYPGVLTERFGRVWQVKFDDGDRAWLDSSRLKVGQGRKSRFGLVLSIVFAIALLASAYYLFAGSWDEGVGYEETTSGPTVASAPSAALVPLQGEPPVGIRVLAPFDGRRFYFIGTVAAVNGSQVDVSFLDGDRRTIEAAELRQDTIAPGVVVSASSTREEGWFRALVIGADSTRIQVRFEDATEEWVPLSRVRVQAQ